MRSNVLIKSLVEKIMTAEASPPWGLAAALLTAVVAFVMIVAGTLVAAAWLGDASEQTLSPFAQHVGWLMAAVLTAIFVLQTRRKPADRAALRLEAGTTPLPLVLFVALGLAMALDLLGLLLTGVFSQAPELTRFSSEGAAFLQWGVVVVLLLVAQPVGEELAFRGVVFPSLRALFGGAGGWLLAAAMYGAFHFLAFAPGGAAVGFASLWYALIAPFFEGLIYGAVRAVTGSTRAAMFAHAGFGLFALAKFLLVAGG
jgi:membrane protease YdiL (CAAX protease family)